MASQMRRQAEHGGPGTFPSQKAPSLEDLRGLSRSTRRVLDVLAECCGEGRETTVGEAALANRALVSVRTVRRAKRQMVACGMLHITVRGLNATAVCRLHPQLVGLLQQDAQRSAAHPNAGIGDPGAAAIAHMLTHREGDHSQALLHAGEIYHREAGAEEQARLAQIVEEGVLPEGPLVAHERIERGLRLYLERKINLAGQRARNQDEVQKLVRLDAKQVRTAVRARFGLDD